MSDTLTKKEKIDKIKEFFNKSKLDEMVTESTLGEKHNSINPKLLRQTAFKLVKINKSDVPADDRDSLKYAKFLGLEDQIATHIIQDSGKHQLKARMKMEQKKNLSWLDSGFFSPQIRSIFVGNALTQNLMGINPLEFHDVAHKVTRLGEGGLSIEAIPDSSRAVNTSQFGLYDPLKISESLDIGVVNTISDGTRLGEDNKLYKLVMNCRTNKPEWISHEKLNSSTVELPNH